MSDRPGLTKPSTGGGSTSRLFQTAKGGSVKISETARRKSAGFIQNTFEDGVAENSKQPQGSAYENSRLSLPTNLVQKGNMHSLAQRNLSNFPSSSSSSALTEKQINYGSSSANNALHSKMTANHRDYEPISKSRLLQPSSSVAIAGDGLNESAQFVHKNLIDSIPDTLSFDKTKPHNPTILKYSSPRPINLNCTDNLHQNLEQSQQSHTALTASHMKTVQANDRFCLDHLHTANDLQHHFQCTSEPLSQDPNDFSFYGSGFTQDDGLSSSALSSSAIPITAPFQQKSAVDIHIVPQELPCVERFVALPSNTAAAQSLSSSVPPVPRYTGTSAMYNSNTNIMNPSFPEMNHTVSENTTALGTVQISSVPIGIPSFGDTLISTTNLDYNSSSTSSTGQLSGNIMHQSMSAAAPVRTSLLLCTAKGNRVTISDKARIQSRAFVDSLHEPSSNSTTVQNSLSTISNSSRSSSDSKGMMVSGLLNDKNVIPSDSKTNSIDISTNTVSKVLPSTSGNDSNEVRRPLLLQKASGKSVVISSEARIKAQLFINAVGNVPNQDAIQLDSRNNVSNSIAGGISTIKSSEATMMTSQCCLQPTILPPPINVNDMKNAPEDSVISSSDARRCPADSRNSSSLISAGRITIGSTLEYDPKVENENRPPLLANVLSSENLSYQKSPEFIVKSPMHKSFKASPSTVPSLSNATPVRSKQWLHQRFTKLNQIQSDNALCITFPNSDSSDYLNFDVLPKNKCCIQGISTWVKDVCMETVRQSYRGTGADEEKMLQWLYMQMRWIVWTLAAHERRHLHTIGISNISAFSTVPPMDEPLEPLLSSNNILHAIRWRHALYCGSGDSFTREQKSNIECTHKTDHKNSYSAAITPPVVSAAAHFSRSMSMSSLQRCAEIATFLWPLVVCFAVSKPEQPLPNNTSNNSAMKPTSMTAASFYVTDGWWWVEAVLDSELLNIFQKGKLSDGCKIVIFNGAFTKEDAGGTKMVLCSNGVRKVRANARLGYVKPSDLSRGISIQSLVPNGGPIYSLRFKVMHVCPAMFRIRLKAQQSHPDASYHDGGDVVTSRGSSEKQCESGRGQQGPSSFIVLNSHELGLFKQHLTKLQQKAVDGVEDDEEMQLPSLLDELGCSDDVIDNYLRLESGGEVRGKDTDQIIREIEQIQPKLQFLRQKVGTRLLQEKTEQFQLEQEIEYTDVLVCCSISNAVAWLRLEERKDSSIMHGNYDGKLGATSAHQSYVQSEFVIGSEMVITNTKQLPSQCSLPLLLVGGNSSIKKLSKPTHVNSSRTEGGGHLCDSIRRTCIPMLRAVFNNSDNCITSKRFEGLGSPNALKNPDASIAGNKNDGSFLGAEISFSCTIIDWFINEVSSEDIAAAVAAYAKQSSSKYSAATPNISRNSSIKQPHNNGRVTVLTGTKISNTCKPTEINSSMNSTVTLDLSQLDTVIHLDILVTDASRTCFVLSYAVPKELLLLNRLPMWLQRNGNIFVEFALVQQIDRQFDIVKLQRYSHTNVTSLDPLLLGDTTKIGNSAPTSNMADHKTYASSSSSSVSAFPVNIESYKDSIEQSAQSPEVDVIVPPTKRRISFGGVTLSNKRRTSLPLPGLVTEKKSSKDIITGISNTTAIRGGSLITTKKTTSFALGEKTTGSKRLGKIPATVSKSHNDGGILTTVKSAFRTPRATGNTPSVNIVTAASSANPTPATSTNTLSRPLNPNLSISQVEDFLLSGFACTSSNSKYERSSSLPSFSLFSDNSQYLEPPIEDDWTVTPSTHPSVLIEENAPLVPPGIYAYSRAVSQQEYKRYAALRRNQRCFAVAPALLFGIATTGIPPSVMVEHQQSAAEECIILSCSREYFQSCRLLWVRIPLLKPRNSDDEEIEVDSKVEKTESELQSNSAFYMVTAKQTGDSEHYDQLSSSISTTTPAVTTAARKRQRGNSSSGQQCVSSAANMMENKKDLSSEANGGTASQHKRRQHNDDVTTSSEETIGVNGRLFCETPAATATLNKIPSGFASEDGVNRNVNSNLSQHLPSTHNSTGVKSKKGYREIPVAVISVEYKSPLHINSASNCSVVTLELPGFLLPDYVQSLYWMEVESPAPPVTSSDDEEDECSVNQNYMGSNIDTTKKVKEKNQRSGLQDDSIFYISFANDNHNTNIQGNTSSPSMNSFQHMECAEGMNRYDVNSSEKCATNIRNSAIASKSCNSPIESYSPRYDIVASMYVTPAFQAMQSSVTTSYATNSRSTCDTVSNVSSLRPMGAALWMEIS